MVKKLLLDADLAILYGAETGALNRAIKRNADRFPAGFMFQLDGPKSENLRCQIGIASAHGGHRGTPYAFTEQGVAMLCSVLHSPRAAQVNIAILRIHSSLGGIRDRLTVARDLLTDYGSIFVQIGNENVHQVRAVMDEVMTVFRIA
jgi:ORF6N domain